jgi:hypothetical protein
MHVWNIFLIRGLLHAIVPIEVAKVVEKAEEICGLC